MGSGDSFQVWVPHAACVLNFARLYRGQSCERPTRSCRFAGVQWIRPTRPEEYACSSTAMIVMFGPNPASYAGDPGKTSEIVPSFCRMIPIDSAWKVREGLRAGQQTKGLLFGVEL